MTPFPEARAVLREAIARQTTPGGVFAVLRHSTNSGWVSTLAAEGHLTYDPASTSITPETSYDLASLSKVLATTSMAMLLWQRKTLDLDMLLADLLPGFLIGSGDGARRRRVTLRMLLAHASGLPASVPFYETCRTREALVRAVLRLDLEAEPGERAAYSDPGFILLGVALETLAGRSLDASARDEVFLPLNMRQTRYRPLAVEKHWIPPTEEDKAFRGRTVQGEVHDENCFVLGGVSGHAGLFAPAGDLLRFAEAMLAPLRGEQSASPFSAEAIRLFTRRAELPPASTRALGWDTPGPGSSSGSAFSAVSFGHLGFTGTSLWVDPERELAVVLLTNRTFPTRANKAIQELRPLLHDAVNRDLQYSTTE
jgi:CubicO group peptidase (beta-lactamase class C family)